MNNGPGNGRIAITRDVSPGIAGCELTHMTRVAIDVEQARRQHGHYVQALEEIGCTVIRLPALPDLADSVFVEDAALVLDELAVLTRPGAVSRRPEVSLLEGVLSPWRKIRKIESPATVDGGDILQVGRKIWVGCSGRTSEEGFRQLRGILEPCGYEVTPVPVSGCLHLKTAVTMIGPDRLLVNPTFVDRTCFEPLECVEVDPGEPMAGNALWIDGTVLFSSAFPLTAQKLEKAGVRILNVAVDELAKAEGGVTCCSLVFRDQEGRAVDPNHDAVPAGS